MKKIIAFTAVVLGIIAEAVLWTLYIDINEYLDGLSSLGSTATAFLYESDYMWYSTSPFIILLFMGLLSYPIFIGIFEFIPKEKNKIELIRKEERCPHCGKNLEEVEQ